MNHIIIYILLFNILLYYNILYYIIFITAKRIRPLEMWFINNFRIGKYQKAINIQYGKDQKNFNNILQK
jgi:hypothetical protein